MSKAGCPPLPVVLVTGATGYLGSNIVLSLKKSGYGVVVLKRAGSDIRRIEHLMHDIIICDIGSQDYLEILSAHGVEWVIHCATEYGRDGCSFSSIVSGNILFPVQLVEASRRAGIRGFINADTVLERSVSPYSLSKSHFREWMALFSGSLCCINIGLEHFYGPGEEPGKFISFLCKRLLSGEGAVNLTPGEQCRDFVFIDDVVSAFMTALSAHADGKSGLFEYQVSSGVPGTIRQVVELAMRMIGDRGTVVNFGAVPYRPNEAMVCTSDSTGLRKLGWECRTSLESGMRKMIDFLEKGE